MHLPPFRLLAGLVFLAWSTVPLSAADKPSPLRLVMRGEADTELAPHGQGNIYAPSIITEKNFWRMWYGGQGKDGHDRIHYAESTNAGASWVKRGVAVENGSANHVNDPSVLRVGGQWFMFYTVAENGTEDAIALATSVDGLAWEKRGVVLPPGPKGAWDSRLVGRPSVLHENGEFRMWYDGRPQTEDRAAAKLNGARGVGLATSKDGLIWRRHSRNPLLRRGEGAVDVARTDNGYVLLHEGTDGTRFAVSSDGVVWKDRGRLVDLSGTEADRFGQVTPHLVRALNGWEVYAGAAGRKTWDGNCIAAVALSRAPSGTVARFDPVLRDVEGWKVHVDPALLTGAHRGEGDKAMAMLANHLQRIKILVPARPLARLQQLEIWIEHDHPRLNSMQYHPGREWLEEHGHDPRLWRKVHVTQARELLSREQMLKHPAVILHELAHAYHDQVLGFDHPEILAAFRKARDSGSYTNVLLYTGRKVRHYGLTDHKEYFAEGTEAFFYRNDFFPFVRAELKQHDPALHEVLARIWEPAD
jgi:dipeptidyl-peptidase-4